MLSSKVAVRLTKPTRMGFTDVRAFAVVGGLCFGIFLFTFVFGVVFAYARGVVFKPNIFVLMMPFVLWVFGLVFTAVAFYRSPHFVGTIIAQLLTPKQRFVSLFKVKRRHNEYVSS